MYAVIKTGGKQYRVAAGDELTIERLAAEPGETVLFDEVLMLGGGEGEVSVGTPRLPDAGVAAEVLGQIRGPKVLNFKRRRRKHSSKRLKGHRQDLTTFRVTEILPSGAGTADTKRAVGQGAAMRREFRAALEAEAAPVAAGDAGE